MTGARNVETGLAPVSTFLAPALHFLPRLYISCPVSTFLAPSLHFLPRLYISCPVSTFLAPVSTFLSPVSTFLPPVLNDRPDLPGKKAGGLRGAISEHDAPGGDHAPPVLAALNNNLCSRLQLLIESRQRNTPPITIEKVGFVIDDHGNGSVIARQLLRRMAGDNEGLRLIRVGGLAHYGHFAPAFEQRADQLRQRLCFLRVSLALLLRFLLREWLRLVQQGMLLRWRLLRLPTLLLSLSLLMHSLALLLAVSMRTIMTSAVLEQIPIIRTGDSNVQRSRQRIEAIRHHDMLFIVRLLNGLVIRFAQVILELDKAAIQL